MGLFGMAGTDDEAAAKEKTDVRDVIITPLGHKMVI
jgi:hypothetical protein